MGKCPFMLQSGDQCYRETQHTQADVVDGVRYCRRHALMLTGHGVRRMGLQGGLCAFIFESGVQCRRRGQHTSADIVNGLRYCRRHAAMMSGRRVRRVAVKDRRCAFAGPDEQQCLMHAQHSMLDQVGGLFFCRRHARLMSGQSVRRPVCGRPGCVWTSEDGGQCHRQAQHAASDVVQGARYCRKHARMLSGQSTKDGGSRCDKSNFRKNLECGKFCSVCCEVVQIVLAWTGRKPCITSISSGRKWSARLAVNVVLYTLGSFPSRDYATWAYVLALERLNLQLLDKQSVKCTVCPRSDLPPLGNHEFFARHNADGCWRCTYCLQRGDAVEAARIQEPAKPTKPDESKMSQPGSIAWAKFRLAFGRGCTADCVHALELVCSTRKFLPTVVEIEGPNGLYVG